MIKRLPVLLLLSLLAASAFAQTPTERDKQRVRPVTVPISIFTKEELRSDQAEEYVQADRLIVKEDKDEQLILSIRSVSTSPLSLAVLIQDELTSDFNLQIANIAAFIRSLPKGTRVLVGIVRGGSLVVRQKFTDDLDRAARSLTIVPGSTTTTAGPWDGVNDVIGRFEGLPTGRRAVLLVSDGYDSTLGSSPFSSFQSPALERAISKAQRRSVAVYSFYSPTAITDPSRGSNLALSAQGALQRISDETGGRAFFQGTGAPVSFQPFFKDLTVLINRQFALTYLSTHMNKGFHRISITSTNPVVKIEHPQGYYYR